MPLRFSVDRPLLGDLHKNKLFLLHCAKAVRRFARQAEFWNK